MDRTDTAQAILEQIGQSALDFVNARDLLASDKHVTFRVNLGRKDGTGERRGNFKFTVWYHAGYDHYIVSLVQVKGHQIIDMYKADGIYCDQLRGILEDCYLGTNY